MANPLAYGLWESPISPVGLAEATRFGDLCWSPDGARLVWLEGRGGHGVIVASGTAGPTEDIPLRSSVRAEVGYGGGDFTAGSRGYFYAKKGRDGLFRCALTGDDERELSGRKSRVASMRLSPDERWVAYVEERGDGRSLLLASTTAEVDVRVISDQAEFYMQPSFSSNGAALAWIEWDHPNMPWDGSRLMVCWFDADGSVLRIEKVAGGPDTAVSQPILTDEFVYFISDESGWDQLWGFSFATGQARQITHAEDERGLPAWIQGVRTLALSPDQERMMMVVSKNGCHELVLVTLASGEESLVEGLGDFEELLQPALSPDGRKIAVVASGSQYVPRVLCLDIESGTVETLAWACEAPEPSLLAKAEHLRWPSSDGEDVFGMFYPPCGGEGISGTKPPLVVLVHGGPTAQSTARFSSHAQFWATRGYGVLAVNYRGSSGYGRAYRNRLRGDWGVVDVEDAVSGAEFLSRRGLVDGNRRVIMGGSAGGYTVLQALVRFPDVFTAGLCWYAVSDLFELVAETHDFESRYVDQLVGVLPAASAVFRERSPVFHAARIERPLAIFQGADDEVVPASQAEAVVKELAESGVPYTYRLYEGEGHGFRRRETVADFFATMDAFLRRHVLKVLRT